MEYFGPVEWAETVPLADLLMTLVCSGTKIRFVCRKLRNGGIQSDWNKPFQNSIPSKVSGSVRHEAHNAFTKFRMLTFAGPCIVVAHFSPNDVGANLKALFLTNLRNEARTDCF